jgi:hypothetical protein
LAATVIVLTVLMLVWSVCAFPALTFPVLQVVESLNERA